MSRPLESTWAYRELVRIDALSDPELILEVYNVMNGHTYSWKSIEARLRCVDRDYGIHLDWNDLCNLKHTWDSFPSLTRDRPLKEFTDSLLRDLRIRMLDPKFLRILLVNLKLVLIRAGVEEEQAIRLVNQNLDKSSNVGLQELWSDCEPEKTHIVNRDWHIGDLMGEEEPLLGLKAGNLKSKWSLKNWLSFL